MTSACPIRVRVRVCPRASEKSSYRFHWLYPGCSDWVRVSHMTWFNPNRVSYRPCKSGWQESLSSARRWGQDTTTILLLWRTVKEPDSGDCGLLGKSGWMKAKIWNGRKNKLSSDITGAVDPNVPETGPVLWRFQVRSHQSQPLFLFFNLKKNFFFIEV